MIREDEKYHHFRIEVPPDFKEVFSHFYFAENTSAEPVTKTLLPSFQTILVFNFGTNTILYSQVQTSIEIAKHLVLGPIKRAFDYTLPAKAEILVANFKEDAFYRFFGSVALSENHSLNPDDLTDGNCFSLLWSELDKIRNVNHRIGYILDFCKPYLKERNVIVQQLAKIKNGALHTIKTIASQQKQSERNIQLQYKKQFGYSAKEMNRFQRFLKAMEQLQNIAAKSSKIDWFEIIEECGFYDQSQLIHDFKHYIHLSPTQYLKFQQDICTVKP
ncbi:AraC family transcriptional regulator [uncultured Cyclobacterium sp.]|uniref:AraC family transcriptional regulator n=1 Tax=uncultured Cyclobacterium sp. TaxID=453820 RepID=UPI0030EC601D|tara:strand:- start:47708 stop:48529 length:822 start_codon:yes stop_codon:yes gene_type:complete